MPVKVMEHKVHKAEQKFLLHRQPENIPFFLTGRYPDMLRNRRQSFSPFQPQQIGSTLGREQISRVPVLRFTVRPAVFQQMAEVFLPGLLQSRLPKDRRIEKAQYRLFVLRPLQPVLFLLPEKVRQKTFDGNDPMGISHPDHEFRIYFHRRGCQVH